MREQSENIVASIIFLSTCVIVLMEIRPSIIGTSVKTVPDLNLGILFFDLLSLYLTLSRPMIAAQQNAFLQLNQSTVYLRF
jgi:hypothetical protein